MVILELAQRTTSSTRLCSLRFQKGTQRSPRTRREKGEVSCFSAFFTSPSSAFKTSSEQRPASRRNLDLVIMSALHDFRENSHLIPPSSIAQR
jgi:hypothetical protein